MDGLKLGTILRQFSDQIGFSFQNEPIKYQWPEKDVWMTCYEIGQIETLVFGVMKNMATQIGLKSSLQDIPNVFASTEFDFPPAQFYPLHSICNAGFENVPTYPKLVSKWKKNALCNENKKIIKCNYNFFQPLCTKIWLDGENPYSSNQDTPLKKFCSGGMVNITGTNLSGIMKTMNYALHSATHQDFDSFTENVIKATCFK